MRHRLFKTARFYVVYGSVGFSVRVVKSLGGCISTKARILSLTVLMLWTSGSNY